jgi:penicillin amidase
LERTVAWFEETQGGDMNEWTWGSLHTATFVSNPLGQSGIGMLERIVNRGPFPADGSNTTVNANGWSWDDPAVIRGHPSMRMIIDLSDFDASRGVHPTGQSGHPFHPHYDDMIPLWLDGEYHPMLFSQAAVEGAADSHLVLRPVEGE